MLATLAAARVAEPAVIQSLKEMVAIESGAMVAPGLGRMTDFAEARLKALGLQVEQRKATANHGDVRPGRVDGQRGRRPQRSRR